MTPWAAMDEPPTAVTNEALLEGKQGRLISCRFRNQSARKVRLRWQTMLNNQHQQSTKLLKTNDDDKADDDDDDDDDADDADGNDDDE